MRGLSASSMALWGILLLAACDQAPPTLEYRIVGSFPHDQEAYTQGLLFHEGHLYESSGLYGVSSVRKVDPASGNILLETPVDSAYFAEGLARVGSELILLTWKEEVALVYDLETLELTRQFEYSGEGWGLCYDGASLYMSNGSDTIYQRDATTFAIRNAYAVTRDGVAVSQLNELECVGDHIYSNVYQTDRILQIDKTSGDVTGELNGLALATAGGRPRDPAAVLNGIAYIPETDVFLMTGKLWPQMLAVKLGSE